MTKHIRKPEHYQVERSDTAWKWKGPEPPSAEQINALEARDLQRPKTNYGSWSLVRFLDDHFDFLDWVVFLFKLGALFS
jgi:hypothetical protein